jgi:outer membrane lipoprotein SlyB
LQKNGQSRVTACTPNISSDHYVVEEAGRSQQVVYGKIVKARPVEVAAHNDGNGTLVGTASGATVGSAIGDSTRANVLGALGGAVFGGVLGNQIGKRAGTQTGIEYIVNLDNGKTISIVQGAKPPLQVGQRVMLMTGGNSKDRLVAA